MKPPLWHVEQLPGAIGPVVPVWLITVGRNTVVLVWQTSHCALVGIWLVGLPSAVAPLWQVEHLPIVVVSWAKVTVAHEVVDLWQLSHCCEVAIWVADLTCALIDTNVPL